MNAAAVTGSTDLATARVDVHAVSAQGILPRTDGVELGEPLEIRVGWRLLGERRQRILTVTMRTPGHDSELAVGFLFSEGAIRGWSRWAPAEPVSWR